MDYRVGGTEVSSKGIYYSKLIKGEKILIRSFWIIKREWNELMNAQF